jgi:hypothetical protein
VQSTQFHYERLTTKALDAAIEWVRDQARRCVRYGGSGLAGEAQAAALRDLNESLLRPARALVEQLAAHGASQVLPTPAEAAQMTEDEEQPHWPLRRCGACRRFSRPRKDDGSCVVCGSKKKAAQTRTQPEPKETDE